MNRVTSLLGTLILLAGCGDIAPQKSTGGETEAGALLDKQAIAAGLLPDPQEIEFAGRFETRSDLGTDKFCAVATGDKRFDIGLFAAFGPESKCEAQGTATVDGEQVRITLTGKDSCAFVARYDGIELRFPGSVESGCASYCSNRASMSGTHYFFINPGDDAARKTLGRDIERLCG